jgi:hypothetical protein
MHAEFYGESFGVRHLKTGEMGQLYLDISYGLGCKESR